MNYNIYFSIYRPRCQRGSGGYRKLSFEREGAGRENTVEDRSLSSPTERDRPPDATCKPPFMEPNIRYVKDKRLQNLKITECVSGRRSRHD